MAATIERVEEIAKLYLGKVAFRKELSADIKDLADEIEMIMAQNSLHVHSFELEDDSTVTINRKTKEKDKLDKEGLAADLDVEKSDLNTRGMVKLAEEGKLTDDKLTAFTYKDRKAEVKLRVKKPKQKSYPKPEGAEE